MVDFTRIASSLTPQTQGIRLRQGTVISVESAYTITVTIAGESAQIAGVKYMGNYAPRPGSQVWLLSDGFDLLALGHLAPRGIPTPRASRSTTQTIADATDSYISFDAVENDGWSCWSSGQAARFTIPIPGRYQIIGQVSFVGNATGFRRAFVEKNGTSTLGSSREYGQTAGNPTELQVITPPVTLAAGDYVRLGVRQNSGAALDVSVGADFGLIYLGPAG